MFDESFPAMDLGFYELNMNGLRVISHGGADELFNTALYLVPDKKLAFCFRIVEGKAERQQKGWRKPFLIVTFLYRQLEQPNEAAIELGESWKNMQAPINLRVVIIRRSISFSVFWLKINIEVSDNRLFIGSGADQQVYTPIGRDLFQEVGGKHQMGFRTDAAGQGHVSVSGYVKPNAAGTCTVNEPIEVLAPLARHFGCSVHHRIDWICLSQTRNQSDAKSAEMGSSAVGYCVYMGVINLGCNVSGVEHGFD